MKRGDIWLIGSIVVAVSVLFIVWFQQDSAAGAYIGKKYARITVDRELFRTVELTEHEQLIEIRTGRGYNLIQIRDGGVRMIEADCPDDLCVLMGFKDRVGETIVCLPNRIIIEIVGEQEEEAVPDAVVN
jgi:hypothetical protein